MGVRRARDDGQIWPVGHVNNPACGSIRGHEHPALSYADCPSAFLSGAVPALADAGRRTPLAHAFVDEWFSAGPARRNAWHRAMCEPRFSNLRDVDAAFEIEAAARQAAKKME